MSTHDVVELAEGWALWPWVCLRGAGFPARSVLRLATPAAAAAVDRLLEAEERADGARKRAIAACERAIEARTGDARKPVGRLLRHLRAGRIPPDGTPVEEAAPAIAAVAAAGREVETARAAAQAALAAEGAKVSAALRELARDPSFREALCWQNRHALRTGVDVLLRHEAGAADGKTRSFELLVARYLQRYSVKNDSIGFFGPISWGAVGRGGEAVELRPGPTLLARREVYCEHWGIATLAAQIAEDPTIRPHVAPRRLPAIRVEGTTLHHPIARTSALPHDYARLLALCDGERSARSIAEELVADQALQLHEIESVEAMLEELVEKKLIVWTLEIPATSAHPERELRRLLERIPDPPARRRGLEMLGTLEAARDRVAQAAGDEPALSRALDALDEVFTELTGAKASRRPGQTYAGRQLVFEDCRRNVELRLGGPLLERLGPPLALVLASARWYTFTIAARYREALRQVAQRLRGESGGAIDFLQFYEAAAPLFNTDPQYGRSAPLVQEVVAALQTHWAELLTFEPQERRVERTVAALREGVAARFGVPGPGWPSALHHSPDLMLVASDLAAIRRGEYLALLGELHASRATSTLGMFLKEHPDPEAVLEAWLGWRRTESIAPVLSQHSISRVYQGPSGATTRPRCLELETSPTRSGLPRERVLSVGALVVDEIDGRLVVRTRDRAHAFEIVDFFAWQLTSEAMGSFSLLAPLAHTPRVSIDGLVLCRERWCCPPEAFDFARAGAPFDRLVGARRFVRAQGLPRFVFVKVPEEPKPCYVDFESAPYVEMFAKLVRSASQVTISEMLPTLEQAWLVDARGQAYTSELRLTAVDLGGLAG